MMTWTDVEAKLRAVDGGDLSPLRATVLAYFQQAGKYVPINVNEKLIALESDHGSTVLWSYLNKNSQDIFITEVDAARLPADIRTRLKTKIHSGRRALFGDDSGPTIEIRAADDLVQVDALSKDIFEQAVDRWVAVAREKYRDWTGFSPRDPAFDADERTYKVAAGEKIRQVLVETPDREARMQGIGRVLSSNDFNLLHWTIPDGVFRKAGHVSQTLVQALDQVVQAVGRPDDYADVIDDFAAGMLAVREDAVADDHRQIAQCILMLLDPDNAIFCRRRMLNTLYREAIGVRFASGSVAEEFQAEMAFARKVFASLQVRGLTPRDLIDVHSLLYVADTFGKANSTEPEEETDPSSAEPADQSFQEHRAMPTNLILFGPPGTGKTYATAFEAVRLCLGEEQAKDLEAQSRNDLMQAYHDLCEKGRVEFVTFHQSFSYEDFVEGLRPTTGEDGDGETSGGFSLRPHDGVFKRISERARLDPGEGGETSRLDRNRLMFKVKVANDQAGQDWAQRMIDEGFIATSCCGDLDWSSSEFDLEDGAPFPVRNEVLQTIKEHWNRERDPEATGTDRNVVLTYSFRSRTQIGDYVLMSDGTDSFIALGQVTGDYEFDPSLGDAPHKRSVKWLKTDIKNGSWKAVSGKRFSHHPYCRLSNAFDWDVLEAIVFGIEASGTSPAARPHVLIVDEINRANISKVFGELITLLEGDKRIGMENEIRLKLPYSGKSFGVPANLHVIGTMNTADRSIALLDTALRRRFTFRELMPRPDVLPTNLDGINLRKLLRTINDRIEYLFDREHQIGHAYFTGCRKRAHVEAVIREKVIPLLAEYFYEDWSKVAMVLGDSFEGSVGKGRFLTAEVLSPPPGLGGDDFDAPRLRWSVNETFDLSEFAV